MHVDLTPEDLAIDPAAWLRAFAYRQERGQKDITVDLELFSGLCRRLLAAEAEVIRLQALCDSLAARCASQAELLTQRAEGKHA